MRRCTATDYPLGFTQLARFATSLSRAVIGTNNATKQLTKFLDSTKEYRAIGLFGCATDSYDSDGKRTKVTPFEGIDAAKIEAALAQFRGEIEQTPPM